MQSPATRQLRDELQRVTETVFRGYAWVVGSFALLVIVPLSLWFAWRDSSGIIFNIVETLFLLSWAWTVISLLQMFRIWRDVGLTPRERLAVLSGPRPDDPDELRVWKSAWRFMFAFLFSMAAMIGIPLADWLTKK